MIKIILIISLGMGFLNASNFSVAQKELRICYTDLINKNFSKIAKKENIGFFDILNNMQKITDKDCNNLKENWYSSIMEKIENYPREEQIRQIKAMDNGMTYFKIFITGIIFNKNDR